MKICWAQALLLATAIILGVGNMLAACGQKGPLYLPDHAQSAPQDADQTKKKQQ